jgi:hypothetical protein
MRAFRADVRGGAYVIEWWPDAATLAAEVAEQYEALGIGMTDASLVALAVRLQTTRWPRSTSSTSALCGRLPAPTPSRSFPPTPVGEIGRRRAQQPNRDLLEERYERFRAVAG